MFFLKTWVYIFNIEKIIMKKFILLILCIVFFPLISSAEISALSALENSLLGSEYKNDSDVQRVERLEQHLYGSKKSGNLQTRIKNIKNDTGYSDPVKEVPKQVPGQNNLKSNINPALNNELLNMKEDASVDYPIVDKMEEEVFKTTYKNENIYKRLDRLEGKVFNKTSKASLNERVDKLSAVISPMKRTAKMPDYNYDSADMDSYYAQSGLTPITDQNVVFQLAVLEQDLLKGNYTNDNISNRLSRLENALFNRTFPTDNDISRLQRVMVAYDAKKNSYKYENNRKMQNVATFSQIGGILLMILAILL